MATTTTTTRTKPLGIGGVPLTQMSRAGLSALADRFALLQRPLPDHAIVEIAIMRLCYEYCLEMNGLDDDSETSISRIKKSSRAVLSMRWREFMDAQIAARKAAQGKA